MSTLVEIPNKGIAEFPDGMDADAISKSIQASFPDLAPKQPTEQGPASEIANPELPPHNSDELAARNEQGSRDLQQHMSKAYPDVGTISEWHPSLWSKLRQSTLGRQLLGDTSEEVRMKQEYGGGDVNVGVLDVAASAPMPFVPGEQQTIKGVQVGKYAMRGLLGYFVANNLKNAPAKVDEVKTLFKNGQTKEAWGKILEGSLEEVMTAGAAHGFAETFKNPTLTPMTDAVLSEKPTASAPPTEAAQVAPPETPAEPAKEAPAETPEVKKIPISEIPDAEVLKLSQERDEKGMPKFPPHKDSVVWGAQQSPEILPELEKAKAAEREKTSTLWKSTDPEGRQAFMAAQYRNNWLEGAIEGVKRQGGNYNAAIERGDITPTEPEETTAELKETPIDSDLEKPPATGEVVGMGGAALGEIPEPSGGEDIYGISQRVRDMRAEAGTGPKIEPGEGIAPADSVERGRQLLSGGMDANKVLEDFNATGAVSPDGMAVARAHGEELAKQARRTEEQFGTGSKEFKDAFDALSEWDKQTKPLQTAWHKMGSAQQGATDLDTGSFVGLAREYKQRTGKDFTDSQVARAKPLTRSVRAAEDATGSARKTLNDEIVKTPVPKRQPTDAEKTALDAAYKTVRENAIRIAELEKRLNVEEAKRGTDTDKAGKKAAEKALKAADKAVQKNAIRIAKLENEAGVSKAESDAEIAKVESERVRKALQAAQESVRKAATRSSKAETEEAVKKSDLPAYVWEKAKPLIEQGVTNFDDLRARLSADLGVSIEDITNALTKEKRIKLLADDMWRKQQAERRVKDSAMRWLRDQTMPGYRRALEAVPKTLFSLKVGFHGTVALGTHAPMVAFQPEFWKTYAENYAKMYRMVFNRGFYEQQVQELLRRPNYVKARRAGLVNDPFQYEDYNSPDTAKWLGKMTATGNRGYSVLKHLRQDMFDHHWNGLPLKLKTPEMASAIADGVNHATGVVKMAAPKGASLVLFAPRLEMSRAAWLAGDPIRAANTFLDWKNATPEQKHFAIHQIKEKAWVVGTMAGLLALNQGLLSATGSKQKINFTDPMKGDFLKFKAAGMTVSYGNPMLTMARLPVRLYRIRESDGGKLKNLIYPDESTYSVLGEYARSQQSPFASLATDLWLKGDWQNRPLPNSLRPIPKRLRAQGVEPYTWPEFWSEQLAPIPAEEALREVWKTGLGMSDEQVKQARKALATISVMAATGARLSDDTDVQ